MEKKTGVPLDSLKEAVHLFCSAEKRAIVFGSGVIEQPGGKNLVKILCTIGSIFGLFKKEETMIFPLIKQKTEQCHGVLSYGFDKRETPGDIIQGDTKWNY
ncbi:MAG: hypothetical protein JRI87_11355 [Deltaproteobacteria bacterium]|nr:hypothetical protein [Deltaproteobacteria bacterium]